MKKLHWKHMFVALSLVALVGCGSDNDDDNDLENEQLPQEEEITNFSTRLNNNLLIAGQRCDGSETTTDVNGGTVTCARDQWLITLDNVNTCNSDGVCTEVAVVPFVAELDRDDRVSITQATFWEIDPISAITPQQDDIIDDYIVRFDLDQDKATVISK